MLGVYIQQGVLCAEWSSAAGEGDSAQSGHHFCGTAASAALNDFSLTRFTGPVSEKTPEESEDPVPAGLNPIKSVPFNSVISSLFGQF